jgi:hypothetical protein
VAQGVSFKAPLQKPKKEVCIMVAFYKVNLKYKNGYTGYFIYKTVKGNIADVFKDQLFNLADKGNIASIELLCESAFPIDFKFALFDQLREIKELSSFIGLYPLQKRFPI